MELTAAEENYLKVIYKLSDGGKTSISTNDLAAAMSMKPASASDMIKRLAEKKLLDYRKYYGAELSELGKKQAIEVIRRNKLWMVFLADRLKFSWDEIDQVADELEHTRSGLLLSRLEEFLGYPKVDPHGEPIPDVSGAIQTRPRIPLLALPIGQSAQIVSVKDSSPAFLKYLDKIGAYIGAQVKLLDKVEFDGSIELLVDQKRTVFMSSSIAANLLVMP
ncbi:DtxR family iron (metal) dependent repressor [Nitritalea halalkaliphila LW7]|uniref:Transcriptional regulator MntR n=1 Tax=Nitritalea halalkaliphila LW7 TaxID=1189621 RepID=I5C1Z6_9BACT|nr:metal-dependent transcriptional regulator [Nitritalea halalkaliphila]EIM75848.1 DtxR family iron (metal) dependent repressor [Nitritalea halalkaliphila LW7]